jgi:hypothetical protein
MGASRMHPGQRQTGSLALQHVVGHAARHVARRHGRREVCAVCVPVAAAPQHLAQVARHTLRLQAPRVVCRRVTNYVQVTLTRL